MKIRQLHWQVIGHMANTYWLGNTLNCKSSAFFRAWFHGWAILYDYQLIFFVLFCFYFFFTPFFFSLFLDFFKLAVRMFLYLYKMDRRLMSHRLPLYQDVTRQIFGLLVNDRTTKGQLQLRHATALAPRHRWFSKECLRHSLLSAIGVAYVALRTKVSYHIDLATMPNCLFQWEAVT